MNRLDEALARWSACLGVAVLSLSLALWSAPASAVCPPCTAMPFVTAQNAAVTAALTAMNTAIVAAVNLHGGGTGAGKQGINVAVYESLKSMADKVNAGKAVSDQVKANMNALVNAQSLHCRLHTMNNVAVAVQEKFEKAVAYNLQDGVIDLFFNRSFTPERTLSAALQRNCKNGQFRQEDMGANWWNAMNAASLPTNQCFEDTTDVDGDGAGDFIHGFLKPSTILDYRVLIPPNNDDMNELNNPESTAFGGPQATWTRLSPKQRAYVSAVRFCENIALSSLQPLGVYGSAALDLKNMPTAVMNMAALAKLDALVYACRSELARRTAPDAAAMVAAGYNDMADVQSNNPRIAQSLIRAGVDPAEFREGGVDYMSSAMLSYGRNQAFCGSMEVAKSMYADTGTDDLRTQNIMKCEQLKIFHNMTEDVHRSLFNNMVTGASRLADQFSPGAKTQIRTEGEGLVQKVSFSQSRAPWAADKKLVDMIKE